MPKTKNQPQDDEQEPLSNYQDTTKTGRADIPPAPPPNTKTKAIEVTAASLIGQLFCHYKYKHTVAPNTVNKVSIKSEVPAHEDLVRCFRDLDAHLAVICEEVDASAISDITAIEDEAVRDKVAKFLATDIVVAGNADVLVLIITGTKELSTKEHIGLTTPKKAIDASYPFATELTNTVETLLREVELYMTGEKKALDNQMSMEFAPASGSYYVEEDL